MEKNNPKTIRAWCMYDWANSVYSLTITTAIFPLYYSAVTAAKPSFFGWEVPRDALYTYAISFSFLLVIILSPILSGIADFKGKKKSFMGAFAYLGALSCIGLYFFHGDNVEYGISMSILASLGYAGSLVFYNAYLPEIVTHDETDRVSALGFSYGYIGSVILLIVNLVMFLNYETFGFSTEGAAARFAFLTVGVWWIVFSAIPLRVLKDPKTKKERPEKGSIVLHGFQELKKVWGQIQHFPTTKKFLAAFFFYSMGVQTVMYLATLFGTEELNMKTTALIITVLILQLLAIVGANLFSLIAKKRGNKMSISIMLCIWILICITAYFIQTAVQFYMLAVMVGMVMGGIQSISRSTYAKLIPTDTEDTASFFSFFDVTEKAAIVIGTLSYAIISHTTGSMRISSLVLTVFFIIGLGLLSIIKKDAIWKRDN